MKKYIGIAGKKGVGKDTAADFISTYGFKKAAFSSPLKDLLVSVSGLEAKYFTNRELKDALFNELKVLTENDIKNILVYAEKHLVKIDKKLHPTFIKKGKGFTYTTPRKLIQFVGTELFRGVDNNYWVKALSKNCSAENSLVISDIRFKEEYDWVKQNGGKVILLERDIFNTDEHSSEAYLDVEYDFHLKNNGSVESLEHALAHVLETLWTS